MRDGRLDEAIELLTRDLRDRPGDAAALYNLACAEARGGRSADALEHLRAALAAVPAYAERARVDPDLDSIRGEPGFPRVD